MRCYVPRIGTIVLIIAIGAGILHGPVGQAVGAVGLVTAALAVSALVVGILTGMTMTARRIQRRRAANGACTTCGYSCQQSMTRGGPRSAARRPLLVGIYTREKTKPAPQPVPVPVPVQIHVPEPEPEPVSQWPGQLIPLTTFLNESLPSPAGSGDLEPGTAEHEDGARTDGDLVPS